MKIVHVCIHDVAGGAAMAAYRLHASLRQLGHDSMMFVAESRSHDPSVVSFVPPMDFVTRLLRRSRRQRITRKFGRYRANLPQKRDVFSTDRSQHGEELLAQLPRCDVINLHWIAEFVDHQTFFARVDPSIPIVWTLHDMNAFTGGCHYDLECGRYAVHCGACPQLGSTKAHDLSYEVWGRKKSIFDQVKPEKLCFVALNRWMEQLVTKSPLVGKFPVTIIPNGLDTEVFAPRNRSASREVLGIPQEAKVLLSFADGVENYRKGYSLLSQALTALDDASDFLVVFLGRQKPGSDFPIPSLRLGYVENARLLSLVYSAADVLVFPSFQDNLPNTILEAMACGTPVIGFNDGGIPDMVRPGVTGFLAQPGDTIGLRDAIVELTGNPAKRCQMASACRKIAVSEYAAEIQARRYLDLYKTLF